MGGTKEAAKAKRRFGLSPHSVAAQRQSMMIVFLHQPRLIDVIEHIDINSSTQKK